MNIHKAIKKIKRRYKSLNPYTLAEKLDVKIIEGKTPEGMLGMTRRLDPMDRVSELGDASVPFNFDVHAMIFSDDAPKLENALHKAFENKKVNMVNQRREFFNVTLNEIKKVVNENFDKTVEFIDVADAEQYRISQKMRS